MKNQIHLTALFLIACGTSLAACGNSGPSQPSDTNSASATDVGSASEAIRQLGRNDADVVARCEGLVQGCERFAGDSGVGAAVCDKIAEHCSELAQQLSEARDAFQQCLEGVAACEASAASPDECRAQRQACNPAGNDFQSRRGETLACAERTQSCMPRMRGPGARGADDADAGANSCDADALDFVGCCHGHGGARGGDAGAARPSPFGQGRGGAAAPGFSGPRMSSGAAGDPRRGEKDDDDAADDADDANDSNNR